MNEPIVLYKPLYGPEVDLTYWSDSAIIYFYNKIGELMVFYKTNLYNLKSMTIVECLDKQILNGSKISYHKYFTYMED